MHGMMQMPLQCVVAGVATAAFVAPADCSSRAARRLPQPHQSLISSWLVDGGDRRPESPIQIQTQTLHAPLEIFENMRQAAEIPDEEQQDHDVTTTEAADAAGLLCLERPIPVEVLRGLGHLANGKAPFKVEVLRAGGGSGFNNDNKEGWVDALTANISKLRSCRSSTLAGEELDPGRRNQEFFPPDQPEEAQFWENSGKGRNRRTAEVVDSFATAGGLDSFASTQQRQFVAEAQDAVRWLKADIKRVASLFAREASALPAAATSSFDNGGRGAIWGRRDDMMVKLELMKKGKCPRFHLDKVPIRLICTYVGPSTEWLDGYDKREMENNRSPPPACNLKISGGREARHAKPGDVLIFRGQPDGCPAEGGAFGVAHRSPDTVEGQRRLVLTMDVGDWSGLAAHPAS